MSNYKIDIADTIEELNSIDNKLFEMDYLDVLEYYDVQKDSWEGMVNFGMGVIIGGVMMYIMGSIYGIYNMYNYCV